MKSTQSRFFDSLVSAVRENPLAACLIGCGALWLLIGDEKLKSAANSATAAASSAADTGTRNLREAASRFQTTAAPPTAPELDHEESFRAGEILREAGTAASDAMSGAADKIRDHFDQGVAYARENFSKLGNPLPGKEAFGKAQSSLADILERQPLVLGAIGLAIGAAVAGAFRTSDLENEWIGAPTRILLVAIGFGYFYARLQADPVPRKYSQLISLLITIAETLGDGLLGLVIWQGSLIAEAYYSGLHRSWGPDQRLDQTIGAGVLWILGDVVGLPFVLLLMRALSRDEKAHAVQVDAELDTAEAAESEGAAPSGLWWENDPQLRDRFRRG